MAISSADDSPRAYLTRACRTQVNLPRAFSRACLRWLHTTRLAFFLLVFCFAVLVPAGLVAQEDWVSQLASSDAAVATAARKKLMEQDAAAFDLLNAAWPQADEKLRQAINQVVDELELKLATEQLAGSRVSLGGILTFSEAFDELEQQSKTLFNFNSIPQGDVDIDVQDVLFWEALDEILDAGLLRLSPYGGELGELSIVARPEGFAEFQGRTAYSGGFRMAITRIEKSRDYHDPIDDGLNVRLQINWESHLRPVAVEQSLYDIKALDGFRDEIPVRLPEGTAEPVVSQLVQPEIPVIETFVPLELPKRSSAKIDRLTGELRVITPGSMQTFEFGKLAELEQGFSIRRNRATVSFFGAQPNDDLYSLSLAIEFDDAINSLKLYRGWILNNEVYVIDDSGKKHTPLGIEQSMLKPNQLGTRYLFDVDLSRCKLVYRSATQLVKVPLKYEFRGIILP